MPILADAGMNNPKRRPLMVQKPDRDIEQGYSTTEFVSKLRRLADALEQGNRFKIQIAGERISVPADAIYTIEHEREEGREEIEFQIKWIRN